MLTANDLRLDTRLAPWLRMTDTWTIGRLLTWTTEFLQQRGSDTPRLDAEVLLAHVKKCPRIALYTAFAEEPNEAVRGEFRELVKQRAAGKPVAYLVGQREFYSLPFHVTPAVLIPRPETEFIVIGVLDRLKQQTEPAEGWRIADVGTGSGIIALTLAKWLPRAHVTAIDISPDALAVAKQNASTLGLAERIEFIKSDLFTAVENQPFDVVASNPPYITTAEMAELAPGVRDFEPHLALEAGPQGTEVIARLIPQAAERLVPGGWFLCEISPMIAARCNQLLQADSRFEVHETLKDLAGHARVIVAQRKA